MPPPGGRPNPPMSRISEHFATPAALARTTNLVHDCLCLHFMPVRPPANSGDFARAPRLGILRWPRQPVNSSAANGKPPLMIAHPVTQFASLIPLRSAGALLLLVIAVSATATSCTPSAETKDAPAKGQADGGSKRPCRRPTISSGSPGCLANR